MPSPEFSARRTAKGLALLALIYLLIVFVIPRPAGVDSKGWSLFGLFAATVAGLITQPLPGGALVLMAVTLSPIIGGLTLEKALSGYADSTVWLVQAAFFISRSLINTGLARRIALFFVRTFGRNSLGVCYALSLTDTVLATIIPSNGARSGGVILPIVRSIAELYGSKPGPTAGLIGSFLFTAVYQSVCISTAMFLTGQASNPLAAQMASSSGFEVSWASWFAAGIVPGLCSLMVVPWVVMRLNPPEIRRTPEAAAFAGEELRKMGPMTSKEKILTGVFITVCGFWITSNIHHIDITLTALLGSVALLVTGVLTWEDVKSERSAWDIFIWYGGLLMLGKALNEARVTTAFANIVSGAFGSAGWEVLLAIALLIYFYAHYAFASITAHVLSMFPAFLAVLIAKGAPVGLTVYAFACFANLSAGLTNYGTTPSPMFFAQDYVSLKRWWLVGAVVSVVNIAIWSTVGFGWWKLIGIW
ncbi:MAG TPA: DASS family sodium-coupled anion symporter [Bryobacteraceae bacterium]|nr:DASS family sodium-coupled anion symporter [Bryobacteraceae bacterium]